MELKICLIIGGGVWGASTAYHLAKRLPRCRIILMEKNSFPEQCGASIDVNKIIRVEYEDPVYVRGALKAQKLWREDPLWSQFYHPAEKVTVGEVESYERILEQFRHMDIEPKARFVTIDELKQRYPSVFQGMAFNGLKKAYVNPTSGWADATPALAKILEICEEYGVEKVQATAKRILFDPAGHCAGILTEDGQIFTATHYILATGAHTPELLANSAPDRQDFRVENRLMASGCVEAVVKLDPAQRKQLANLPITVHDIGEIYGEVLPPNEASELKFAGESTFLNSVWHEASGQTISVVPRTDVIPQSMKDESRRICNDILGPLGDAFELGSYRICWDNFTLDGDWIISPHPSCDALYFATGGSFHSWKFFPILGELVVQMLEGALDEELQAKWAWDRQMEGSGVDKAPSREWRDLIDKGKDEMRCPDG